MSHRLAGRMGGPKKFWKLCAMVAAAAECKIGFEASYWSLAITPATFDNQLVVLSSRPVLVSHSYLLTAHGRCRNSNVARGCCPMDTMNTLEAFDQAISPTQRKSLPNLETQAWYTSASLPHDFVIYGLPHMDYGLCLSQRHIKLKSHQTSTFPETFVEMIIRSKRATPSGKPLTSIRCLCLLVRDTETNRRS